MDFDKYVYYDIDSPSFLRWKIKIGCGKSIKLPGEVAGSFDIINGYWRIKINKKKYYVQRVVYCICKNVEIPDKYVIDHIDGNRVNNCIDNLRMVKQDKNVRNRIKAKINTTGITGVSYNSGQNAYSGNYYIDGQRFTKSFAVATYGQEAFTLACKFRDDGIILANQMGADYTERHGK